MKFVVTLLLSMTISLFSFAQKRTINYYVGGLLYCKYTFYENSTHAEASYIEISNTQNYNGKNYICCSTCRYENNYKVSVYSFENQNNGKQITLFIREITPESCILVFQDENKNDDKTEIYYAKVKS